MIHKIKQEAMYAMKNIRVYLIAILIPLAVGGLASILTSSSMMMYGEMVKPPLAPPPILFPIVWTILYILMGIGSARVYLKKEAMPREVTKALRIYALQLGFNFFWSLIFFNLRAFLFAFIWLIALWGLIIIMLFKFYKIDKIAAIINIPYILWVTFAAYLNFAIYILN